MDIVEKNGDKIDIIKLSKRTKMSNCWNLCIKGKNIDKVVETAQSVVNNPLEPINFFNSQLEDFIVKIENNIDSLNVHLLKMVCN